MLETLINALRLTRKVSEGLKKKEKKTWTLELHRDKGR